MSDWDAMAVEKHETGKCAMDDDVIELETVLEETQEELTRAEERIRELEEERDGWKRRARMAEASARRAVEELREIEAIR